MGLLMKSVLALKLLGLLTAYIKPCASERKNRTKSLLIRRAGDGEGLANKYFSELENQPIWSSRRGFRPEIVKDRIKMDYRGWYDDYPRRKKRSIEVDKRLFPRAKTLPFSDQCSSDDVKARGKNLIRLSKDYEDDSSVKSEESSSLDDEPVHKRATIKHRSSSQIPIAGMINSGNKCFSIAVLQSLISCIPISKLYYDKIYLPGKNIIYSFHQQTDQELRNLVRAQWIDENSDSRKKLDLKRFEKAAFNNNHEGSPMKIFSQNQHDSAEFFRNLLRRIDPRIQKMFELNAVRDYSNCCDPDCKRRYMKLANMGSDIQLDIPRGNFGTPSYSMVQILNHNFRDPVFDHDCTVCGFKNQERMTQFYLDEGSAPRLLFFAIKRYMQMPVVQGRRAKFQFLNNPVFVPLELYSVSLSKSTTTSNQLNYDTPVILMDDFPSPPVDTFSSLPNNALNDAFKMIKYRLQAVILKSGGLGGGHYTAMISYENQWYHCNDRVVKLIPDIQKVLKDLEVQRLIYNVIYERDL